MLEPCCRVITVVDCILLLWLISADASDGDGISCTESTALSRPMQRKLITLISCQILEEEGRARAARATRSLGERSVSELILLHQNSQQLSAYLWAAVRARGCQFLGPGMNRYHSRAGSVMLVFISWIVF